ncbi:hypothetical protein LTR78_005629 [Recurvomyces mirabilis]|uniref:2EXR domain-containing protein n=1 Tax=Recurvomyces mirabilis TaxID=574656 RepID=A0AAE0WMI1_9PEZI|nr:hypothetical protein LTR78_005629 [Recurvomyces mirabilis]KAK5151250.1 hypothetical protein LTS14_009420 [Recurvomyces mirabilis]
MAKAQTFEDKLQTCIAGSLREEYPYTHTSTINNASSLAAGAAERAVLWEKRQIERQGVRPLDFMDLPPELRSRIYEMVLRFDHFGDRVIQFDQTPMFWFEIKPGYRHPACQPAITRVSRLLREETLKMFYSINTFSISLPEAFATLEAGRKPEFEQWLEGIGETNAARVGRVILRCTRSGCCPDVDATRLRIYLGDMEALTRIEQVMRVAVIDHDGTTQ